MSNEQAKSELMQIYGMLSEEKKQALDVLMAQNCDQCEVGNPCLYCEHEFKAKADRNEFYNWDAPIRHKADGEYQTKKSCETCKYSETFNLDCARCDDDMTNYAPKQADGDLISKNGLRNAIGFLRKYNIQAHKTTMDAVLVDDVIECINGAITYTIPPEHDGCKDCKYETYPEYYYPCCECKQNYKDMWEMKEPTDTITMTREEFSEKLMEHYRQGRADEKAYQNGEIMQSFNPD